MSMATFKTLKEFKDSWQDTLRHGDIVTIHGIDYNVGYEYLTNLNESNVQIFMFLGINDQHEFASKIYWYETHEWGWPVARHGDFEALTRLYIALCKMRPQVSKNKTVLIDYYTRWECKLRRNYHPTWIIFSSDTKYLNHMSTFTELLISLPGFEKYVQIGSLWPVMQTGSFWPINCEHIVKRFQSIRKKIDMPSIITAHYNCISITELKNDLKRNQWYRSALKVIKFSDILANPKKELTSMYEFLDMDPKLLDWIL